MKIVVKFQYFPYALTEADQALGEVRAGVANGGEPICHRAGRERQEITTVTISSRSDRPPRDG